MTPWWVSIAAGLTGALVGALVGFGIRAMWEEYRDFLGAQRLVVSELRANARALRLTNLTEGELPETMRDAGFRSVQTILARRLPTSLWNDLDRVYSLLTPQVQGDPSRLRKSKLITRVLLRHMDEASRELNSLSFRKTVSPWSRGGG